MISAYTIKATNSDEMKVFHQFSRYDEQRRRVPGEYTALVNNDMCMKKFNCIYCSTMRLIDSLIPIATTQTSDCLRHIRLVCMAIHVSAQLENEYV